MRLILSVFALVFCNNFIHSDNVKINLHDDLLTVYKELTKPENDFVRNFSHLYVDESTKSCIFEKLNLTDSNSAPAYAINDIFAYFYRESPYNRKKQLVLFYAGSLCKPHALTESFKIDFTTSQYSHDDVNCLKWQLRQIDNGTVFVSESMNLTDSASVCDMKFEQFKRDTFDIRSDLTGKCVDDLAEYENDNVRVFIQSLILVSEKPVGDQLKVLKDSHEKVLRSFVKRELKCALVDLIDSCDESKFNCQWR